MVKLENFKQGQVFPPKDESQRIRAIFNNRQLYNNETNELVPDTSGVKQLKLNLFRRAVDIYTNFLLSEGVSITSENLTNQSIIDTVSDDILNILYMANTDLRRYGSSIVSINNETGYLTVYEPDQWYQVLDDDGQLVADIIVEYLTQAVEIDESKNNTPFNYSRIKIITNNYSTSKKTVEIRELKGSIIGELKGVIVQSDIVGRQVATMFNGYNRGQEGLSMFDDIKDIVADMIKIKRTLSSTLENNGKPHLVGSGGMLVEENGLTTVKKDGMFLPMETGDNPPFYLQWDTNAEAVKYQIEEHWSSYFTITAIPPIIFTNSTGQSTSGEALKRLVFPFLSVLAKQRQTNLVFVRELLTMLDNFRLSKGMPRIKTDEVVIQFEYDKIFIDNENIQENDAQRENIL